MMQWVQAECHLIHRTKSRRFSWSNTSGLSVRIFQNYLSKVKQRSTLERWSKIQEQCLERHWIIVALCNRNFVSKFMAVLKRPTGYQMNWLNWTILQYRSPIPSICFLFHCIFCLFVCCLKWNRASLCSLGWLQTPYAPALGFWELGLQVCMPWLFYFWITPCAIQDEWSFPICHCIMEGYMLSHCSSSGKEANIFLRYFYSILLEDIFITFPHRSEHHLPSCFKINTSSFHFILHIWNAIMSPLCYGAQW